ncbi:hypothetical protein ACIA8F_04585 [Streptomyces sp. NPDC051563]|uniref:hypothetical protein n=1 Tax=Streptomyces sp. NPDC051563 TaxID=3365659 RepID=UPI0037AEFFC2
MIHVFNPAKGNKWLYLEMIREQRTEGDLPIGRNGMEYVIGILTHLNRSNGKTFVADSTISKQAGYRGNSHEFREVRKVMMECGFLHVWGTKSRAYEVSLLVPERLHEEYDELQRCARRVEVLPKPSRIRELTHDPQPMTHNSGPGTLDPGPLTQISLTPDPEGRESKVEVAPVSPATDMTSHVDTPEGCRDSADLTSPVSSPSVPDSEPTGSGGSGAPDCPCGSQDHEVVYKPQLRVAGELHHNVLVCPEIAAFGGIGGKDFHLVLT